MMFHTYPWQFLGTPGSLWLDRVLLDLSDLRDQGAIDDNYLSKAWLTLSLAALEQNKSIPDDIKQLISRDIHEIAGSEHDEPITVMPTSADDSIENNREPKRGCKCRRPPNGGPTTHLIPNFKIAGRKWTFHQYDRDANRPAPHGHADEDPSVVLDPYTGEVTEKDGSLKSAKDADIAKLWGDAKFREFATKARAWMKETQPLRTDALPELPPSAVD